MTAFPLSADSRMFHFFLFLDREVETKPIYNFTGMHNSTENLCGTAKV